MRFSSCQQMIAKQVRGSARRIRNRGVAPRLFQFFVRLLCSAVRKDDLGDESDVVEAW